MPTDAQIFKDPQGFAEVLPIPIALLDTNSVVLGVNQQGLKAIDTRANASKF